MKSWKLFTVLFLIFVNIFPIKTVEIIKVGLLIPKDDVILSRDCGMYNSYGAIPLAIDRIVTEQLLNNYNFSLVLKQKLENN